MNQRPKAERIGLRRPWLPENSARISTTRPRADVAIDISQLLPPDFPVGRSGGTAEGASRPTVRREDRDGEIRRSALHSVRMIANDSVRALTAGGSKNGVRPRGRVVGHAREQPVVDRGEIRPDGRAGAVLLGAIERLSLGTGGGDRDPNSRRSTEWPSLAHLSQLPTCS